MDKTKKIELLADIFDMNTSELNSETKLEDLECWDSMTQLSLIVCFSDNFNKTITKDDFRRFVTVEDILVEMEE